MELKEYLYRQQVLDNEIMSNCTNQSELMTKKILALQTEVSEFANATKCFKYWSKKAPESEDRQLEEFVDIFHFFLSIANLKGYTADTIAKAYKEKNKENFKRQKTQY